jgi:WD40 repeat protein
MSEGHTGEVNAVAVSPDGTLVASGGWDSNENLWDVQTRKQVALLMLHTYMVTSVAFSPDGTLLASASGDRTVRLWDATQKESIGVLRDADWIWLETVTFHPDGETLVVGSRGRVL